MKFNMLKTAIASAILLAGCAEAQAGNGLPNFLKRWEIGYSYSMANATYQSTETIKDGGSGKEFTRDISQNVNSKFGYGGFAGTYIPMARLGGHTLLALGIDYAYNAYMWDYKVPEFSGFTTDENGNVNGVTYSDPMFGFSAVSVQMALPVSLDLKFGGEATLEKYSRWTGTFGAGVHPSLNMTVDYGSGGFGTGITPFIKGEVGLKAGIVFKLRAQYAFGNIPFYEKGNNLFNIPGLQSNSQLTGKNAFTLSLVIMPFSFNWKEDGWWNDHH
ncbi:hypothetical protein [Edaphocola aurantiacus]|uniref:hypothetical protein n=1 Tax=Edaphocola aurantiacus TaxID=2601682 RepID=UPI001C985BA4|nr:hypothetical protein [Edaphocola aurantiacus]